MKYTAIATAIAIALAPAAFAQTQPKPPSGFPPSQTATANPVEAKFKSADKNGNGMLEGAGTDAYKSDLTKIDTNKDGKVSKDEFQSASRAGVIK